jgi:hypothetical protein
MIPAIEAAFPDHMIVVRPHPTENPEAYCRIAERCNRVRITNEGNVVPWLLAAKVLIHNGCTTGVEAYVMGVPAVSYRAYVNEDYDYGFYRLPNLVSHQVFSLEELKPLLREILAGKIGAADGQDRKALIDRHLAALDGKLACERIVDVLETIKRDGNRIPRPARHQRMQGRLWASARAWVKRTKAYLPGSHNKPAFQRHRYPEISMEDMRSRVQRFQSLLGSNVELSIERIQGKFFRIGAC